jgi:hypothetical protein
MGGALRRVLLRRWVRRRHEASLERIRALEQWHRIFDEWLVDHRYDYDEAAEMANQGLTFLSWMLKQYYLPMVKDLLSRKSLLI